jgi:hypothetical protein
MRRGRPTSKLTGSQVVRIRKLFLAGRTRKEIHAELPQVTYAYICVILKRFGVGRYYRHDNPLRTTKVGSHRHRVEYEAYAQAKARCTNPKLKRWSNYGGRGIQFKFTDFASFLADIGPKPDPSLSLDRINNDGHYEPGNVRWATAKQQANNRRKQAI